jgi:hypothetical protein
MTVKDVMATLQTVVAMVGANLRCDGKNAVRHTAFCLEADEGRFEHYLCNYEAPVV